MALQGRLDRVHVLLLVLSVTAPAGCALRSSAVAERLQEANDEFVGQPADRVRTIRGEPDAIDTRPDGTQVWSYRTSRSGPPDLMRSKARIERLGGRETRENLITWTEVVTFTIGIDGTVKRVSAAVR